MKNAPKFPLAVTIFLVLALVVSVAVALQQTYFTQASLSDDPMFISVGNERSDGFTVAWVTTKENIGTVIMDGIDLSFSESDSTSTHVVEVTGLDPSKQYSFSIQSADILDNNGGLLYSGFTTSRDFDTEDRLMFGRIFGKDSVTPLDEGFVAVSFEDKQLNRSKHYHCSIKHSRRMASRQS